MSKQAGGLTSKSESLFQSPPSGQKKLRRTRLTMRAREAILGYAFISPWLIGFILFTAGPILAAFLLSFTRYDVLSAPEWTGLRNYQTMLAEDPLFWKSLWNTVYYVSLSVPLTIILSFGLALLLNANISGRAMFRAAFYLPSVMPFIAVVFIWVWIFSPRVGLLNYLLQLVGLPPLNWLASVTWSKPAMVLMSLWNIGIPMIIFLAGLQGIHHEYYEAAELDGANPAHRLFYITVPLMTPVILYNVIIAVINSFQVFVTAYVMTDGGPLNSSRFYVLHLYHNAFSFLKMGYASALAWVLFLIILLLTLLLFRSSSSWVHYGE